MEKKSIGNRMSGYGSTVNTNANAMSASLKRFLISCAVDKNALKTKLTEPKRTETNNRQKKRTKRSRSEKDRADREKERERNELAKRFARSKRSGSASATVDGLYVIGS